MKIFKKSVILLVSIFFVNQLACSQKMEEGDNKKQVGGKAEEGKAVSLEPKSKFQLYTVGNRNVKVIVPDGKYLWIGTSQGLFQYDKTTHGDFKMFTYENGLLSNGIFSVTKDKSGNTWVGTYGGGLSAFDGTTWKNYNVPNGLADSFIYDVLFKDDGTMWIATWSGANKVVGAIEDRKNWQKFTVKNTNQQLGDDWVYALDIDSKGVVWFGTEVGISTINDKGEWSKWAHPEGMGAPFEIVNQDNAAMNAALSGSHHAGQQRNLGLLQKNVSNYNPNYVVSMAMDKNDMLWIGTWGGGLSRFDTNKKEFKNFTVRDGLPGNYIIALAVAPDGNIWVGTNEGLSRFDGSGFKNFTTKDGLPTNYVFSLVFDDDGTLWAGGWGGLTHFFELPK